MKKVDKILTTGLQKGFAGETEFTEVRRGGFALQASHLEQLPDMYHDEWAADRVGGGQELVKVGEQVFTRVYAGGTIALSALAELKIAKADIMQYLIKCLTEFGEATRLAQNYGPKKAGDWGYKYTVLEEIESIPLTVGKEEISFKGKLVFVHVFLLCPVE